MNKGKVFLSEEERSNYTNDYLKIVGHCVSTCIDEFSGKHGRIPYTFKELEGEAIIGFVNALNTFDKSKEIQFTTYSFTCMRNSMLTYIYKHNQRRYLQVQAYYKLTRAYDKIEEYEDREFCQNSQNTYLEMLESGYEIVYEKIDHIEYDSIPYIENANVERLINSLEKALTGTSLFVFVNYINPHGDFVPKMNQSEIAKNLNISQPAVSKSIKKIEKMVIEFLQRDKSMEFA